MAFRAPDGGMTLELMNSLKQERVVNVSWHGRQVRLKLPAISIATALWRNQ
jgi:O-glycosyl hydrolase